MLHFTQWCTLHFTQWCMLHFTRWCMLHFTQWCTLHFTQWCMLHFTRWCMLHFTQWCMLHFTHPQKAWCSNTTCTSSPPLPLSLPHIPSPASPPPHPLPLTPYPSSSSPEGPVLKHCQYIFQDLVDMAMCCGPVFVGRLVQQDMHTRFSRNHLTKYILLPLLLLQSSLNCHWEVHGGILSGLSRALPGAQSLWKRVQHAGPAAAAGHCHCRRCHLWQCALCCGRHHPCPCKVSRDQ